MNTKTFGIALVAAWIAALVWVLVLLDKDDDVTGEPGSPQGSGAAVGGSTLGEDSFGRRASSAVDSSAVDSSVVDSSAVDPRGDVRTSEEGQATDSQAPQSPSVEADGTNESPAPLDGDATVAPAPDAPLPIEQREPDELERRILRRIFQPLEAASERYAKHDDLPESRWIGEDQGSNQAAIDTLLDEAIQTLGVSAIDGTRQRLRAIRQGIATKEQQLARDREARLSAPSDSELSAIQRPLTTTRENYDKRIRDAEEDIADFERERADLETRFVDELRDIGLEVTRETARGLLSTVSGEDFVEMCVVFHNVRLVTVRLQHLTEEAGESLDVARRYYGSYVVLVRILDHIQKDFVRRVRDEQVPRLDAFAEKARLNIDNARRNLGTGGDPRIAEQNIGSNELTLEACRAYSRYLLDQAAAVEAQNRALQPRLRDAINTFDTVQLSSQVAEAIRDARRNFAALLELDVPDLRGFENVELQREFERLTDQLFQP